MLTVEGDLETGDKSKMQHWMAAVDVVTKEIPELLKRLEEDFRAILGVPSHRK
jgi:hypothetical protein